MFYSAHKRLTKHMNCKAWRNKEAYTMIELLISLAILSILVVSFIQIVMSSVTLRSKSDFEKRASALANYTIEAAKDADSVPSALNSVQTTDDGFTVSTNYVEKTSELGLTQAETTQNDTSVYSNAPIQFNFSDRFSVLVNQSSLGSIAIGDLKSDMTLEISEVSGSTTQVDYFLTYEDPIGTHKLNLGRFMKHDATAGILKILISQTPPINYSLAVKDNTGEKLNIGVFDDTQSRINIDLSGASSSITVDKGLVNDVASSKLSAHYYEMTVVVSRDGQEYARILTTIAVQGD